MRGRKEEGSEGQSQYYRVSRGPALASDVTGNRVLLKGLPLQGEGTLPAVAWLARGGLAGSILFRSHVLQRHCPPRRGESLRRSYTQALLGVCSLQPWGPGPGLGWGPPLCPARGRVSHFALGKSRDGAADTSAPPGGRKEESLLCCLINTRRSSILSSLHFRCSVTGHLRFPPGSPSTCASPCKKLSRPWLHQTAPVHSALGSARLEFGWGTAGLGGLCSETSAASAGKARPAAGWNQLAASSARLACWLG